MARMRNAAFWVVTCVFALLMLAGGLVDILSAEAAKQITDLGYPGYLPTFLGIAKILGAAALIFQRRFPRLGEWAYAGFAIDLLGAAYSHVAGAQGWRLALPALVFLAVLVLSYRLRRRESSCCGCACAPCGRRAQHGR